MNINKENTAFLIHQVLYEKHIWDWIQERQRQRERRQRQTQYVRNTVYNQYLLSLSDTSEKKKPVQIN